jgi:predicted dehydrogenase
LKSNSLVKVAILGCGSIGAELDLSLLNYPYALTHATAFGKNKNCQIVAFCDQNESRAKNASARWIGSRSYINAAKMFVENSIDLIVISTPSKVRLEIIELALSMGIKYFVIEKPLATTLEESEKILDLLNTANAKSVVNFSRRWDYAVDEIRKYMYKDIGEIQRAIGFYGKGLINNGSHMIDLAANIFNSTPVKARGFNSPLSINESNWSNGYDQAIDAQIVFSNDQQDEFSLNLISTDHTAFTYFNFQIFGSKGIYEYSNGGRDISFKPIVSDPNYLGYKIPGESEKKDTFLLSSFEMMAAEAIDIVLGKIEQSRCDAHCAYKTALTIEAIKKSMLLEGQWINLNS